MKMVKNAIFKQDCLETMERMSRMSPECIDLVVTSPPYDDLRKYDGYSFDFKPMPDLFMKILKPGGMICWVVADQIKDFNRSGTSFRQAIAFQDAGFKFVDHIIYEKNVVPFQRPGFYDSVFEFIFCFSKGRPKTINLIKDHKNLYPGRKSVRGFTKKEGDNYKTFSEKKTWIVPQTRKRTNIWKYAIGGNINFRDGLTAHPAPMPEKLADDLIKSFSNKGDLVYDPFTGSGTTLKSAYLLGRYYFGSEISQKYCDMARARLKKIERQQVLIK